MRVARSAILAGQRTSTSCKHGLNGVLKAPAGFSAFREHSHTCQRECSHSVGARDRVRRVRAGARVPAREQHINTDRTLLSGIVRRACSSANHQLIILKALWCVRSSLGIQCAGIRVWTVTRSVNSCRHNHTSSPCNCAVFIPWFRTHSSLVALSAMREHCKTSLQATGAQKDSCPCPQPPWQHAWSFAGTCCAWSLLLHALVYAKVQVRVSSKP